MSQEKNTTSIKDLSEEEAVRLFQLAKNSGLVRRKKATERSVVPVARSPEGEPLALAQRRIWFLSEMEQGASDAYVINGSFRLEGLIDVSALQETLNQLAARHESLRTVFDRHEGEPVQRILPVETGFCLTLADAGSTDLSQPYLPPFDLTSGPLACAELVRISEQEHILRVALHHAIADGWSMSVLIRETGLLYAALTQGQPNPLLPLPVQFADYAHWQQALPAGELKRQQDYWSGQLKDAPEYLDLITTFPRPAVQDHRGAGFRFHLEPALTSALKTMSHQHGTTLFMTLFASWGALMGRLANQDEVVIGVPVAGRNRAELEGLIGMFVNTQALRVDLSDNPDAVALLAQVKETTLAAQAHQDIPFEKVVEAVSPARNPSRSPVFQVLFGLQNLPDASLTMPGLKLSPAEEPFATAKFDLSLLVEECGDTLSGFLNYATSLFDESTAIRYLSYWKKLLEGMVASPQTPLKALPLLDDDEYQQVIYQFNETHYEYPSDTGVHTLFSRQAQQTPDALAMTYEAGNDLQTGALQTGQMSYATLEAHANSLARRLQAEGVEKGHFVVMLLPRGPQLVVAELAILKCGAAYVPMDPQAPQDRLDFVLADCGAKVILTSGNTALDVAVPAISVESLLQETSLQGQAPVSGTVLQGQAPEEQSSEAQSGEPVNVPVSGLDPAYVMYTSGSTGKPKGVMIPHRGIARLVINNGYMEVAPDDRVAFAVNPVFDVSSMELWAPLLNGASVVVVSQETLLDAVAFSASLSENQVSILWLTVGLFNHYVDRLGEVFSGLKYLLVGGDALNPATIRQVLKNSPPQMLLNGYGPTEATTFALTHEIREVGEHDVSIPLGRPIGNTQIYVLNDCRQPVPCGVVGEIYIAGDGVALEYLGRPDLNEVSFLTDPFSDQPGARMYKSGDLGYWREDGILEFMGRNDFQVKIRGFRIELGEIEAALRDSAGVRQAMVIAQSLTSGEKRLVAYVSGENLCTEALKAQLGERLPAYMVPAAFVVLDQLPLNGNGKVDRKALPEPGEAAFVRAEYEPPQGEAEQQLAGIWQSLLQTQQISRHDNFFELGGHSLLAVQMIEQLRQHGIHLAIRDLFAHPTLAGLAGVLAGQTNQAQAEVPPNLIPPACQAITPEMLPLIDLTQDEIDHIAASVEGGMANIQDIYPLAPLQEGILFHHLLQQEGDPYVTRFIHAFSNETDIDVFVSALQTVIQRHDILRTSVVWEGLEAPVQVVWREAPVKLNTLCLNNETYRMHGDVATALKHHFDPVHTRMDVRCAPMIEMYKVADPTQDRWLLCFLCHHLCNDHTTLELVSEEVMAYLSGLAEQLPQPLPFRNFVARSRAVSDMEHQAYFSQQLAEIEAPCAPFGLLDIQHSSEPKENLNVPLESQLSLRLRTLARQRGMSTATLFHLAWGLVVRAATGHDDVVFGTVLFGRMDGGEGADRVMGMFLNTLPLRLSLADLSVEQALQQTCTQLAGLLSHEHASLVQAQQCSGVESGLPLFTSLLNYRYQGGNQQPEIPAPLEMSAVFAEEDTNYPLNLSVNDIAGEDFSLDVMVVPGIGAARIAGMMNTALSAMADALEQQSAEAVSQLNVLPEPELHQVLHGFNQNRMPFPHNKCIHQLFESFAQETPSAIALVSETQSLTYAQLNCRANQLAHWLRSQGIQPEERVGVSVPRSVELVVAMLAIFKAGGVYVPMDPNYPDARLIHMLTDSAPKVLITTEAVAPRLAQTKGLRTEIDIHRDQHLWADLPETCLSLQTTGLKPEHLAYLIYTSGSTGLPKGVMVPHHGLCNVVSAQRNLFSVSHEHRVLQFSSVSFDASVFEMVMGLCSGAQLHLAGPAQLLGDDLSDVLRNRRITHVTLPPAALSSMRTDCQLPDLKVLITAGEALSRAVIEPWLNGREVYNAYGPTETTIWSSTAALHHSQTSGQPSIGIPVENTRTYILDTAGKPVPVGVCGEIYIGGVGVARGYLNRDDLTEERFLPDPFSGQPGARMYRTGDLACWKHDGSIDYRGRIDHQVKIRGHRIEPGEIETVFQQCDGVRSAVVVPRKDSSGYLSLTGYYTLMPDAELTPAEIKSRLSQHLPDYMVPAAYVVLDDLPLTPNGKIDHKALPEADETALIRHEYEAPQGETEQQLAGIWQQLLGVEQVGRHDHFFGLGGHSLMAVQLASRVRDVMGYDMPLTTLFSQPVLHELAQALGANDGQQSVRPDIRPLADGENPPLSLAQKRLWFLSQMEPASTEAYVVHSGVRLTGSLDVDALQRAMNQIAARHAPLRTRFAESGGVPVQIIGDVSQGVPLTWLDQRFASEGPAAFNPEFDLTTGPLIKGQLIRISDGEHWLRLAMHHIITDGWSMGILTRELSALYAAFCRGEADPLPPLAIQYGDYAAWQATHLSGDVLQQQQTYWETQLKDIPDCLNLPADCPRPQYQDYSGAAVPVYLNEAITQSLKALSKRHGCTLYMTLLASWAALMNRLSGEDDVVIGSPVAGRTHAKLEALIGMFVNTLAMRVDLSGKPDTASLLKQVKATSLAAQSNQDLPFEQVVETVSPVRNLSHSPVFQVMFTLQNMPEEKLVAEGLTLSPLPVDMTAAQVDLSLQLYETEDGLEGVLNYATALFSQATAERYLGYWQQLLAGMLADPSLPLNTLPLLDNAEYQQVIYQFNETQTDYPSDTGVHSLYARLAQQQPQAPAVIYPTQEMAPAAADRSWNYAGLEAAANALAGRLLKSGVKPGQCVAVLLPRSPQLIVAELAILKCGAVYVPLDPATPQDRRDYVLSDCGAELMLIDEGTRIDVPVQLLTVTEAILCQSDAPVVDTPVSGDAPAYVMYTSGSTGKPKGVVVPHRAIVRLVINNGYMEVTPSDRVAFAANPAFDATTMEVWAPLLNGASVVVIPQTTLLSVDAFAATLTDHQVSILWLTVGLFNQYADGLGQALGGLKYLLIGGDALDPKVVRQVLADNPPEKLLNGYGPTETTTFALTHEIESVSEDAVSIPLGRPISNTQIYLLDSNRQPVPRGVTGEIYIGGDGVALGYLGQPELTENSFMPDPFSASPDARMYKSGDSGYWRADGTLEFAGRNDFQVKIRGFRIEPGEIEVALQACEGVQKALVIAQATPGGEKQLVAYVTGQDLSPVTLKTGLMERLPVYMVPAAYVVLDQIPLTANGKVDRRALPQPDESAFVTRAYEAPKGAMETRLADIWCQLLGVKQVGRHDDFFELGGHSLLAVQLIAEVRHQLKLEVTITELFENASLSAFAAKLAYIKISAFAAQDVEKVMQHLSKGKING